MAQQFETVLKAKTSLINLNLRDLWKYRDLILLFVRRTFVSQYKQTVLGPAWAVIQPLFTTVIFTVVFGNIAGLSPDGIPTFVFYLGGSVLWTFFSTCLTATASTFVANSAILGKVYFPRLVMPVSTVLSQFIAFAIQFVFFICFWVFYLVTGDSLHPNIWMLMTPVLLIHLAALSLGFGIIISSLTTKYRDLTMAIGFGVQLWMYFTPVAYDVSIIPEKYVFVYMLNPVSPIITMFRYAFLGVGELHLLEYLISFAVTIVLLFIGIILFNRVERTFMDTV